MDTLQDFVAWISGLTPPSGKVLRGSEEFDEERRRTPFDPRAPYLSKEEHEMAAGREQYRRDYFAGKRGIRGDVRRANLLWGGQQAIDQDYMSDDPSMIGAVLAGYQGE